MIWRNQVVEKPILLEEIQINSTKEQKVLKKLDKNDGQSWKEKEIVYIKERIYVLNNKRIWEQILQENHDLVDIGHLGQQRMLELVKINYWWSGIKGDVKKYVQECMKC